MTYQIMDNGVVRHATDEEIDEILARKASAVPRVPQRVTRRQARQALLLNDLLDEVTDKLAAIEDPMQRRLAQIEWEDATDFERTRPLLLQMATALGLDDKALDDLFIQAATL